MRRWLLLLGLSGCAFALQGPEATPARTYPRCDTGKNRVLADGVIAAGLEVAALASTGGSNGAAALIPALAGVAFIASAVKGNSIVEACRKAQDQFLAAQAARAVPVVAEDPAEPPPPPPPPAKPAAPSPAADPWAAFWKVAP